MGELGRHDRVAAHAHADDADARRLQQRLVVGGERATEYRQGRAGEYRRSASEGVGDGVKDGGANE